MRLVSTAFFGLLLAATVMAADPIEWTNAGDLPQFTAGYGELDAVFHDGILHVVTCDRDRHILHAQRVDNQWTAPVLIAHHQSGASPAVAVCDDVLHMVHVSKNSPTLWHATHDRWGDWQPPVQVPGVQTIRIPELVAANGRLHVFFVVGTPKADEQAPVAYSVLEDGRWQAPMTIEGYVCYGQPSRGGGAVEDEERADGALIRVEAGPWG